MKQERIHFPFAKALAFSARSVRIRMGRMMVVLMGVSSAIAFLVVLLSLDAIMQVVRRKTGGAEGISEMRRWWFYVAVLISIAGITNAILMSVTERIKEIGTIRCLGAMSWHIVEIFLLEAMFLGLVGGFMGGLLGLVATYVYTIVSYGWGMVKDALTLRIVLEQMGWAMGLSMGLCVISSIYPVYFAARLEPADAMRYEV